LAITVAVAEPAMPSRGNGPMQAAVENHRQAHEPQGRQAVACAAKRHHHQHQQDRRRHADEDDAKISVGQRDGFGRRAEQAQDGRRQEPARDRHRDAQQPKEAERRPERAPGRVRVAAAERLPDQD
jgi:hypothetical protein